jgi:hypothetical protein
LSYRGSLTLREVLVGSLNGVKPQSNNQTMWLFGDIRNLSLLLEEQEGGEAAASQPTKRVWRRVAKQERNTSKTSTKPPQRVTLIRKNHLPERRLSTTAFLYSTIVHKI